MASIGTILTALGAAEKLVPVVEAIAKDIAPLIQAEIADGEAIWKDIEKAIADLKTAISAAQAATKSAS